MLDRLERVLPDLAPGADFCAIRFEEERTEGLSVRQDVVQPVHTGSDRGAMVTVADKGGIGYAATSDLSEAGLQRAAAQARAWAERTAGKTVTDFSSLPHSDAKGRYESEVGTSWDSVTLEEKIDILREQSQRLKVDDRIVDWIASVGSSDLKTCYLNTRGARIEQRFRALLPTLRVTANEGTETQSRTLGGHGVSRQGGMEVLTDTGFLSEAPRLGQEAVELLSAPDCPTDTMALLLAPDQMVLQIHESIGHPLELDRILGDERNYAGTSFVTLDMFGSYRYGSDLLNVTFDPTRSEELASYAFDDEGRPAEKAYIIKDGILVRPLGGTASQARAGLEGVANARACRWNRPPIDRMANLNLEPGSSSLPEMIGSVERGVYMASNNSWSIDDSRNKFQFGCEYGRLIENGELTKVVKKPNYRGISATFWRSLEMVGDESTFEVLGVNNCGKGEPNQLVRVGHASPVCLFENVDVFGGA